MKFKSLLLVVGFIPALAMAEVAKPAPEKAPPVGARPAVVETQVAKPTAPEKAPAVVARPAVVTHVYHHHYHYGKMPWMIQPGMMPPPEIKMVPGQMVPGHWAHPPNHFELDFYVMPHIYIPWVPPK